jgi:hypothetical protein
MQNHTISLLFLRQMALTQNAEKGVAQITLKTDVN